MQKQDKTIPLQPAVEPTEGRNMKRRKLYGVWFECLRPGVWRSECGWYLLQRICGTYWEGCDLESGTQTFGNGLAGAAWHALGKHAKKKVL